MLRNTETSSNVMIPVGLPVSPAVPRRRVLTVTKILNNKPSTVSETTNPVCNI